MITVAFSGLGYLRFDLLLSVFVLATQRSIRFPRMGQAHTILHLTL